MCHLFAQVPWAVEGVRPFSDAGAGSPFVRRFALSFPLSSFRSSLFANLLDVTPRGMIVVTLAGLATAWTTLVTGWVVLSYGYLRFPGITFQPSSELPQPVHFAWSALLTLPVVAGSLWYSLRQLPTRPNRMSSPSRC